MFSFIVFLFLLFQGSESSFDESSFENLKSKVLKYRYDDLDSAFFYLTYMDSMVEQEGNMKAKIEVLYLKGGVYYVNGDYVNAQFSYDEAFELAEKLDLPLEKARILNGRGLVFLGQHKYDQAIDTWKQSLQIFKNHSSMEFQPTLMFNIGLAYSQLGQFDTSLAWLDQSIDLAERVGNQAIADMAMNRRAKVYFDKGEYQTAENQYQSLLEREEEITNWERTFLYAGLAELELKTGSASRSAGFAEKAFEIAETMKALWDQERALAIWSEALEKLGNFPKALEIARFNKLIADSLFNKEKEREINFLQLQVVEAQNKELIQTNELIRQKAQLNQRFIFGLVAVIGLLLGVVLTYRRNLKLREKFNAKLRSLNVELEEKRGLIAAQNESLNQINEAKNKLFSILSHDLRSPLGNLKSFVLLDKRGAFDENERQEALGLLENQLDKTDYLLENLFQWARTQLEGFDPNPEMVDIPEVFEEILGQFELQLKMKGLSVKHVLPTDSHFLAFVDKNNLKIILQNILGNAIKFSPKNGEIVLFYSEESRMAKIHIRDNGEGLDDEKRKKLENEFSMVKSKKGTEDESGTGLGLLLVKQLLVYNGGYLLIRSFPGRGTEMIVCLKPNDPDKVNS